MYDSTLLASNILADTYLAQVYDKSANLYAQVAMEKVAQDMAQLDAERRMQVLEKLAFFSAAAQGIGKMIAGPATKGVARWAGGGAAAGGLAGAAGRILKLTKLRGMDDAALKQLVAAADKAKKSHGASGALMAHPSQSGAIRQGAAAEKVLARRAAAGKGQSPQKWGDKTWGQRAEHIGGLAKDFAPDVLRSAAAGAGSGAALAGGAKAGHNLIKRQRVTNMAREALPWVAGGAGLYGLHKATS